MSRTGIVALAVAAILFSGGPASAVRGNGRVARQQLSAVHNPNQRALAAIGDLDGDGVPDLASGYDVGNRINVLFMNADGTVATSQTIGAVPGSFTGDFGAAVGLAGDVDADGVQDLVVGAPRDDDFWEESGAVWILFMNTDGTVKGQQKISSLEGGLGWLPHTYVKFGTAVAGIGDVDDDGTPDIAVGAPYLNTTATRNGAVYVLFLNPDGTVKAKQVISDVSGGFMGTLVDYELFGISVASLGDFDADGTPDLVVGAEHDPDGGPFSGAVWVLTLMPTGAVKTEQKISARTGGFKPPHVRESLHFGHQLTAAGDVDGDGVTDIAVTQYIYTNEVEGVVWLLFLRPDGTVKSYQQIDDVHGGLVDGDDLSIGIGGVAAPGDIDGDGIPDLALGVSSDVGGLAVLFGGGTAVPPCTPAPRIGCAEPSKATITLKIAAGDDAGDHVSFKWSGTTTGALGDPTTVTTYALCLYDGEAGGATHVASARAPAGIRWTGSPAAKLLYKDKIGSPDGITLVKLNAASPGRFRIALAARGPRFPMPVGRSDAGFFVGDPAVTVQLVNDAGGCWTVPFTIPTRSGLLQFKAKAP